MSSLSFVILGACLGSVISVFAMVAGIVADDRAVVTELMQKLGGDDE